MSRASSHALKHPPVASPSKPAGAPEDSPALAVAIDRERRRGRGAQSNISGRYETEARVAFDDGWQSLDDLPPFKTIVSLDTARNFGVAPLAMLWRVTIPSALTSISTGLRVSATIALIVTVTTELVAGNSGIGFYVSQTEQANRIPPMYAGILLTGILGYIINAIFFQLERRVVFWAPSSREQVQ